jgi:lipopolysaccharide/colanic/teichoic acid biosynthesis glycosyltransferase
MSRLTDAVIAGVLLAFTVPLIIIVATAIRFDSPGPVFEREPCIGRRGRRFHIRQFRTRTVHHAADPRPDWAVKREGTRVGAFLRYTRIESLPQLLNVLAGDMSIVELNGRSPSFFSGD